MDKITKTFLALITTILAVALLTTMGCKKDNITGPEIIPPPSGDALLLDAKLGQGQWEGQYWTIPVVINNQVKDLRAMSVKVTVSPSVSDANFSAAAGTSLSNVGSSLMLMNVALPTYVQVDWAVGTEQGWSGTGEVIKLKFNQQVTTSSFTWKAYNSSQQAFHP